MPEKLSEPVKRLVGKELAAVTFVRDYVQLAFDGLGLTALTPIVVATASVRVRSDDDQFRNRLCELIGTKVVEVDLQSGDALHVRFCDGWSVSLSLRAEDYCGPEAIIFDGARGEIVVF